MTIRSEKHNDPRVSQHDTVTSKYKRILVVDDDKEMRAMVIRALKKSWPEIETEQAGDGIQAVRIAKEFLPGILILDLMLPGQDGFAVLNALKHEPQLKSTLVLGITAYNSPENIKKLASDGAFSCLIKPFGPEDLETLLSPYLEQRFQAKNRKQMQAGAPGNIDKKPPAKLMNIVTFLGLMLSTLFLADNAKGISSKMTKTTRMEEPVKVRSPLTIQKVAVMPFESSNHYIAGKSFSDTLIEYLNKRIAELSIIERPDIEKVLSEQRFSLTGAVKQGKIKNVGGIEPVDALVTGTVRTMEYFGSDGGSIVVTVKIVAVNNGQILWSHKQEARCYTIGVDRKELAEELMNRAAKKIVKRMKSDLFSGKRKVIL